MAPCAFNNLEGENIMKKFVRIIAVITMAVFLLSLCGCGEVTDAKKTLQGMLDTLKDGNYDKALEEYICEKEENKDFLGCVGRFNREGYPAYDAQKALFNSIEYEILDSRVAENGSIFFTVKITTLDLEPVGDRLMEISENFQYNYMENSEAELTDELEDETQKAIFEQQIAIINEYMEKEDKPTREDTVEVEVCSAGKDWGVHLNDKLINSLAGGLYTKYGPVLEQK